VQRIRLVVVEQRTLFRQALVALLKGEPDMEIVGEAAGADEARLLCLRTAPDAILLDESLLCPEIEQELNLFSRLTAAAPAAALVVMGRAGDTTDLSTATVERARTLQEGATAYVCATIDHAELARCIRNAVQHHRHEAPALPISSNEMHVTERERAVAALIATGLCNKEIAQRLGISTQTVKNHVSHVLEKLALADRTQLAVYALEHGLA
jgi:DNA-binding NarL/FixJ family response regulator